MKARRVRGRLKSLSHTGHRPKKKEHDEKTNRKGKLWAKQHVAKERVELERRRKEELKRREQRKRLERKGVIVAGDD